MAIQSLSVWVGLAVSQVRLNLLSVVELGDVT